MSQLSPLLLESLTHWLVTRMRLPEELNVLKTYIDSCQGANAVLEQLPTLPKGQAYFYSNPNAGGGEGIRFWAGPRLIPHIRHLHKYLRAPLPEGKRFYFQMSEDSSLGLSAANLWEFRELLSEVSAASLHYHLERGDFERWLGQVLHDEELAQRVHKVADRHPQGEELRRALLQVVVDRYEELEALI